MRIPQPFGHIVVWDKALVACIYEFAVTFERCFPIASDLDANLARECKSSDVAAESSEQHERVVENVTVDQHERVDRHAEEHDQKRDDEGQNGQIAEESDNGVNGFGVHGFLLLLMAAFSLTAASNKQHRRLHFK